MYRSCVKACWTQMPVGFVRMVGDLKTGYFRGRDFSFV